MGRQRKMEEKNEDMDDSEVEILSDYIEERPKEA